MYTLPSGKWFRIGYGIIIVMIIIYLATKIDFIFKPIFVLIQTLFTPIIIAGLLYYLIRPLVDFLAKKMPRPLAIFLVFLTGLGIMTALVIVVYPEMEKQINNFSENLPDYIDTVNTFLLNVQNSDWFARISPEQDAITEWLRNLEGRLDDILATLTTQITKYVAIIANILIIMVIVPFILFYLLKDGEKLPKRVLGFIPEKYRIDVDNILDDMDDALSSYIQGQVIVSVCVGVLIYIGYLIIDLPFALILAALALVTNFIPFIGPWIGTAPGVIVGLLHSPFQALLVVIVAVVAQQIESNLISPQVMGRKLRIHPITIIFLLLFAGRFGGIVAMIIAVPTYAVIKVIVSHTYRIIKLRNRGAYD
ncbi:AI-2E family transporter [Bacillaceae bacterium W0354]